LSVIRYSIVIIAMQIEHSSQHNGLKYMKKGIYCWRKAKSDINLILWPRCWS